MLDEKGWPIEPPMLPGGPISAYRWKEARTKAPPPAVFRNEYPLVTTESMVRQYGFRGIWDVHALAEVLGIRRRRRGFVEQQQPAPQPAPESQPPLRLPEHIEVVMGERDIEELALALAVKIVELAGDDIAEAIWAKLAPRLRLYDKPLELVK